MARVSHLDAKKQALTGLGVLILLAAAYVAVIPTVVANHFMEGLEMHADELQPRLKAVANGPARKIFEDPDLEPPERQSIINGAGRRIDAVQASLSSLERSNSLPPLPGNGFAGDYHEAIVRQEITANMIKQSRQVLNNYADALKYINAYTGLQINLDDHLDKINRVRDFNTLVGDNRDIAAAAAEVRDDEQTLAGLRPPPGLEQFHSQALATFDKASNGFKRLASGLRRASDSLIYSSVKDLEAVTDQNQVEDKDTLVNISTSLPVLRQLDELPEKVEHALGR